MTITATTVQIPVADGTTMAAYLVRPNDDPAPVGVIVAHELFAVSPDIRSVVDRLAEAGFLTLAPEFYHRHAEPGRWLERDDAGRQEGFALLHQLERDHALADVDACLSWLAAQPGIERTAMIGFSAGGHLAYLAACRLSISRTACSTAGGYPPPTFR